MVSTANEDWLQLEEIFYQSAIVANEWIFRRSLHICTVLDLFIRHGSCLLNKMHLPISFSVIIDLI